MHPGNKEKLSLETPICMCGMVVVAAAATMIAAVPKAKARFATCQVN